MSAVRLYLLLCDFGTGAMKLLINWVFLILSGLAVAGCSNVTPSSLVNLLNGGAEQKKTTSNASVQRYVASIHLISYSDLRKEGNPHTIGTGAENVSGMNGKDIAVEQDVATMVTAAIRGKIEDSGIQISEAQIGNAQFELTGVVKELTYNVKTRDEVSIAIESTLKEISTGKVVWSAIVTEKSDRFAGISGNSKSDVIGYLHKELGVVSQKTADAISSTLMAVHPELFNLTPGTKPIPGVTVLVAPAVTPAVAPAPAPLTVVPVPDTFVSAPTTTYAPHASETNGLLLVNTNPARAKVYLDGVYFGLSPLRLELEPGVHALSAKLTGYKMVSEKVSVRKGDSTEIDLDLEQ